MTFLIVGTLLLVHISVAVIYDAIIQVLRIVLVIVDS